MLTAAVGCCGSLATVVDRMEVLEDMAIRLQHVNKKKRGLKEREREERSSFTLIRKNHLFFFLFFLSNEFGSLRKVCV